MGSSSVNSSRASDARIDEISAVLNAFRSLVKELRSTDREAFRIHGLGSAQIYVLHCLASSEPLSVNRLAAKTLSDQSTISLIVSKLVAKDLVESRRSEVDTRSVVLTLSPKGRKLVKKVPMAFQEKFVGALESLPPSKVTALRRGLKDLLRAMGVEDEHPPMLLTDSGRTPQRAKRQMKTTKRTSSRRK